MFRAPVFYLSHAFLWLPPKFLSSVLCKLLVTFLSSFTFWKVCPTSTYQLSALLSHFPSLHIKPATLFFIFAFYSALSHLRPQIDVGLLFIYFFWTTDTSHLFGLAVQDLDEGFAKFNVESGVYDRVDGTIEVSQPGNGAVQRRWDAAASAVGL